MAVPTYALIAEHLAICKTADGLVESSGFKEKHRAGWEWLVSENLKYGMVVMSKKAFNAQTEEAKRPYKDSIKLVGLSSSPDKLDLLVTESLTKSLIKKGTPHALNCLDAKTP